MHLVLAHATWYKIRIDIFGTKALSDFRCHLFFYFRPISQFKDFIELLNLVELAYETDRYYLMPLTAILVKIVTDQLIV